MPVIPRSAKAVSTENSSIDVKEASPVRSSPARSTVRRESPSKLTPARSTVSTVRRASSEPRCSIREHEKLEKELKLKTAELEALQASYDELDQTMDGFESVLQDPKEYRRSFQTEHGKDIFEVLKADFIMYLKATDSWPSGRSAASSPTRGSVPTTARPYGSRSLRLPTSRLMSSNN